MADRSAGGTAAAAAPEGPAAPGSPAAPTWLFDPQTGAFRARDFFEFSLKNGIPLFRYVDDMGINWHAVGARLGRSERECQLQMQYLLDDVFLRSTFSDADRETLGALLLSNPPPALEGPPGDDPAADPGTDPTVTRLQEEYFWQYSLQTIACERWDALACLTAVDWANLTGDGEDEVQGAGEGGAVPVGGVEGVGRAGGVGGAVGPLGTVGTLGALGAAETLGALGADGREEDPASDPDSRPLLAAVPAVEAPGAARESAP